MFALALCLALASVRSEMPLDGTWTIETKEVPKPIPVRVPDAFESALGDDFDGIATYRTEFRVPGSFSADRLFLEFDAVATHATVFVNDAEVGSHLGGWTRFSFDITDHVVREQSNRLRVVVDERVGHDTQGFLPIIAPHFGGIWQSVRLVGCEKASIDPNSILLFGDATISALYAEAKVRGDAHGLSLAVEAMIEGTRLESPLAAGRTEILVPKWQPWSPNDPRLYPVDLVLRDSNGRELDRVTRQVGFRSLRADGEKLFLNDRRLSIRGILEWGYYPPARTPNRDLDLFIRQLHEAKARGFNLIKFCLWVPPQRLLDAMDEVGMLAWIEYPTWHPKFDAATRPALLAEFDEFFQHDRSHPSVIVRSLTCETGHGAPIEVMRDLYQRAHDVIPNAFVEDDSSWIEWHRIHDFYDDHPYGNNDTWSATIDRLAAHVDAHGAKPLLLGEAIAADTWLDRSTMRGAQPHFRPIAFDALDAWEQRIAERFGNQVTDRLERDSLRYCLNERKDQIEVFRAKQPDAGYVVSVARDFRLASMGLADAFDRWKWRREEWAWHGDTMILLEPGTPRGLSGGSSPSFDVYVAHFGDRSYAEGKLEWRLGEDDQGELEFDEISPGQLVRVGQIGLDVPEVYAAYEVALDLAMGDGAARVSNRFVFHVLPPTADAAEEPEDDHEIEHATDANLGVLEVSALSVGLIDRIANGQNVLLEVESNPGSFVAPKHWMLRGSLWMPDHPVIEQLGRNFFLDLCVHELHPKGLVPLAELFDRVDPIVAFFDTHDHATVDDYGLLFETAIGSGRLMVSALPLHGTPAAEHLRSVLIDHLIGGDPPTRSLPEDLIQAMKNRLEAESIDLTPLDWQFRTEPENGEPSAWATIRVGQSWEGQGFPNLDGHARYRIEIDVPAAWAGKPLWLAIDGADDAYWITFDGAECGSGGDVENRKTAFDTKADHRLAETAAAGQHVLEIRVLDWYGAGGLHRPIHLATAPTTRGAEFLIAR